MSFELILSNLLNPPILFFFLGMLAVFVGSDLEIPNPLPKLLSLYLLLSIGFKGGVELNKSGLNSYIVMCLLAGIFMALLVPFYSYFILRRKLDVPNAAAAAATYGSISAVTFIAASSFLSQLKVPFGGHMVAAMALMESPAIVIGVALARRYGAPSANPRNEHVSSGWGELLRDAFFNGSVLLLVGSLVIGALTGESGEEALHPFTSDIFKGMLCLFLLDMGLVSARQFDRLKQMGAFPILFALLVPLLNAALGITLARVLGMSEGDALMFCILSASASYIAVPAAMRLAVPEANPGLYVSMALALTFPFNIVVGMPIYMFIIQSIWR
jgi:hypothetical protein